MPPTDPLYDGFLFRALLDSMPDSVYVKDREARLLRVSLSMVRNLGLGDRGELVQRRNHAVTASVGISLYPEHASDASGLLTGADYAMYLAKRSGKDRTSICPTDERAGSGSSGTST